MFNNVGGKIKVLSILLCWVGIISSVVSAIIMFIMASKSHLTAETFIIQGIVCLFLGPLVSWLFSLFPYGFGELIERMTETAQNTEAIRYCNSTSTDKQMHDNSEKETNFTSSSDSDCGL